MKIKQKMMLLALLVMLISACSTAPDKVDKEPTEAEEETEIDMKNEAFDPTYIKKDSIDVIYLAGGCFWGLEKLMQSIPGVVDVISGYANGDVDIEPTYKKVTTGRTGYRETVRVEYDPNVVSLDTILFGYFHVIDPKIENRQGNDVGTQYQTGVYFVDETSRANVERIAAIEQERHDRFVVEIEPLERFYDAEEYHQDYLDKNPYGYCHISGEEMRVISEFIVDAGNYPRPSDEALRENLTDLQYRVTQSDDTERAFSNEYWDNHADGIYVDVVTGEPLFSSRDKFDSGTGWPSFTSPIDDNTVRVFEDRSHGTVRVEVRSRAGNSHLGHLFFHDPSSPNGVRYCINSAALRFVPYEEMETEGYAYLQEYVK